MKEYKRPEGYWKTRQAYTQTWRETHRDEQRQWFAKYRQENSERLKADQKRYRELNKNKPEYKLRKNLRERLRAAMKGLTKSKSTMMLVGCSLEELKTHLAKQFQIGMTWENYGVGWHIDHIKPCVSFDLLKPEAQLECFHYSNLQPLWAIDNIRKGKKIVDKRTKII